LRDSSASCAQCGPARSTGDRRTSQSPGWPKSRNGGARPRKRGSTGSLLRRQTVGSGRSKPLRGASTRLLWRTRRSRQRCGHPGPWSARVPEPRPLGSAVLRQRTCSLASSPGRVPGSTGFAGAYIASASMSVFHPILDTAPTPARRLQSPCCASRWLMNGRALKSGSMRFVPA
jgi:hypothetical protein